jgi:hypothetical protein
MPDKPMLVPEGTWNLRDQVSVPDLCGETIESLAVRALDKELNGGSEPRSESVLGNTAR